jgi:predicted esterase YcpF (UPF0227 family)
MELKILYVYGYGINGIRLGKAIERHVRDEFGTVKMAYRNYSDEICGVQQIKKITAQIVSDCREFCPHIVIGLSFDGFLATNVSGFVKILINPCLLPSEHVNLISPNISDDDLQELKVLERAQLELVAKERNTWGLFSHNDELFGGNGYKELCENVCGQERVYTMDSPHRIDDNAIQKNLIPIIKNIVTDCMPTIISGQVTNCSMLMNYFSRHPELKDGFISNVCKGMKMDKLRVMTLLIDMYMEYCHVSMGYRTAAYDMGWAVFREYVSENETEFTGEEHFCEVMEKINPNYILEEDDCDIGWISIKKSAGFAMQMYVNEHNEEICAVLCYGIILLALSDL